MENILDFPPSSPTLPLDPEFMSTSTQNISTDSITASPTPSRNKRLTESFIWKHKLFSIVETSNKIPVFVCNLCNKQYKKSSRTRAGYGTLYRHLKISHNITQEDEESLLSQDIQDNENNVRRLQKEFNLKIAQLIVRNFLPFTTVDSKSFKDMAMFNQAVILQVPSSTTIKRLIEDQYTTEREKMKTILRNECNYISLITDIWSSHDKRSFMGIIGSFIDHKFTRKEFLLDFFYIGSGHTGKKIEEHLMKCILFYEIDSKVVSVVSDNAANNRSALHTLAKTLKYDFNVFFRANDQWIRCGCHIINLIAKKFTKGLYEREKQQIDLEGEDSKSPISKLRELILKIRSNEANIEEWKANCKKVYSEERYNKIGAPIYDCETRWNSTYAMIQDSLDKKDALQVYEVLKDRDWKDLLEISILLKPLAQYSDFFQRKSVSIPYYLLCLHKIDKYFHHVLNNKSTHPSFIVSAVSQATQVLSTYYKICSASVLVLEATIFDPRYKLNTIKHIFSLEKQDELIDKIENSIINSSDYTYENLSGVESTQDDLACNFFSSSPPIYGSQNILEIRQELEEYLNMEENLAEFLISEDKFKIKSVLSPMEENFANKNKKNDKSNASLLISHMGKFNILEYWKKKSIKFPGMALLARKILCTPISSCSVERLFSLCRDCIGIRRCSLDPDTLSMLMYLKYIQEV